MVSPTLIAGGNESVVDALTRSLRTRGRNPTVVRSEELDQRLTDMSATDDSPDLVLLIEDPQFDRTVTRLRRLRSTTTACLVTVGEDVSAHRILASVRAGSDDYLDLNDNLDEEVERLLSRITETAAPKLGQIVSLYSANGGSGCSTLATNCAAVLAKDHGRCALLDLQPWAGDLSALLDVRPKHSVADLARNLSTIDSAMLEQSMHKHENGIHLLGAPQQYPEVVQLSPDAMTQILQTARNTYPHVILDVQDSFHDDQLAALNLSDVILLVLRLDFVSLRNTRRTVEYLERNGVESGRIELVANRCGQSRQLSQAQAEDALKRPIQHLIPDDPKRVIHAMNCGVPVVLESPSSKVSRRIRILASSLAKRDIRASTLAAS
tara:strand:- start:88001 stop:89140 length:1140 start_codon:yes stop_codon:yes gene_type:complete